MACFPSSGDTHTHVAREHGGFRLGYYRRLFNNHGEAFRKYHKKRREAAVGALLMRPEYFGRWRELLREVEPLLRDGLGELASVRKIRKFMGQ